MHPQQDESKRKGQQKTLKRGSKNLDNTTV